MNAATWTWLHRTPLAPAWRRRLEVGLGVVLSGAAVVALSASIRPDPSRLPLRAPLVSSALPDAVKVASEEDTAGPPRMTPEFAAAVRAGNARAMTQLYRRDLPLQGMLGVAAGSGKKAPIVWLLEHGADIHDHEGMADCPVLESDAHPELTAFLRAAGAVEATLESAATANAPNAIDRILATRPDVNHTGIYPLQEAAHSMRGTPAQRRLVVEKLVLAGADPNRSNGNPSALAGVVAACDDGPTATECTRLVRILLDHGARVKGDAIAAALAQDEQHRRDPLAALLEQPLAPGVTAAALASAQDVDEVDLQAVLAKGIDWTFHDGEDDAALPVFGAVRHGDRDYVKALLDAGAPVDYHSRGGESALAIALDGSANDDSAARIVELLVSRGANVNRRLPDGRTPLFAAAEVGALRVVTFLLAKGARVNERVLDDSALDIADQNGHLPVARVLHAHGGRRLRQNQYP